MDIRFISGNEFKIREVETILAPTGVKVITSTIKLHELQTEDVEALVKDKVLQAFSKIGRPVFVEHTGLRLSGLNGLPGGLTQIFWDRLKADAFAELVNGLQSHQVTATTTIGYCDTKNIHFFTGEISGTVPSAPAGCSDFQWDCVFVPDGYSQTFAEMGEEKNKISMRRLALEKFAAHIGRHISGPAS
jgi:XTP/dITP diphosphohydrolase